VHLPQLTPALQAPLQGNREVPDTADGTVRADQGRAIDTAVRVLAKKEGRSEDLRRATNSGTIDPADVPGQSSDDVLQSRRGNETYLKTNLQ
jgi:hypothetical protein